MKLVKIMKCLVGHVKKCEFCTESDRKLLKGFKLGSYIFNKHMKIYVDKSVKDKLAEKHETVN